eukprot:4066771-Alexandrium_andersonii.AAC.1
MQRCPLGGVFLVASPQPSLHSLDVLRHGPLLVVAAALGAQPQPRAQAACSLLLTSLRQGRRQP